MTASNLAIPPPSRIAIGSAQVGNQRVEIYLSSEWARYFETLNLAVAGQPGAQGVPGVGTGIIADDEGGSADFIPGPIGNTGPPGNPGPPAFLLQSEPETPDMIPGPTGNTGCKGDAGTAVFLLQDDQQSQDFLPGPKGEQGIQGIQGQPLFLMDDEQQLPDPIPGPKGDAGAKGDAGPALFLMGDDSAADVLPGVPTQINEAWIAPTLLNSWVNYDATGATFNTVAYYKDAGGIVRLRGFLKSGTVATTVFTLPAGYRPTMIETFATNSNDLIGRVYIDTSGNVVLTTGSNVFFTLDGMTFRAAGTF